MLACPNGSWRATERRSPDSSFHCVCVRVGTRLCIRICTRSAGQCAVRTNRVSDHRRRVTDAPPPFWNLRTSTHLLLLATPPARYLALRTLGASSGGRREGHALSARASASPQFRLRSDPEWLLCLPSVFPPLREARPEKDDAGRSAQGEVIAQSMEVGSQH